MVSASIVRPIKPMTFRVADAAINKLTRGERDGWTYTMIPAEDQLGLYLIRTRDERGYFVADWSV